MKSATADQPHVDVAPVATEELLTADEVLHHLIDRPWLRKAALSCVLPAVSVEGKFLYRRHDLDQWVDAQNAERTTRLARVLWILFFLCAAPLSSAFARTPASPAAATASADADGSARSVDFPLRGKKLSVKVYRPAGTPKGTVIMGSGDVGWVGLAVSMSEHLSANGYVVVGVNMRQYLSTFTDGKKHLETHEPAGDYDLLHAFLEREQLVHHPVVLSGVSEGAAISILAASQESTHRWIDGVVTMGTPMIAELAWRWTDFTSWITKKDADEPSFSPADFIHRVAPLPLVMIQSRRDEYVTEADYRKLEVTAQHPKRLVLIDASNHRFTDRQTELRGEVMSAITWISENLKRGSK